MAKRRNREHQQEKTLSASLRDVDANQAPTGQRGANAGLSAAKAFQNLQSQANAIVKTGTGSLQVFGAEITPAGLTVPDAVDNKTLDDIAEILIGFERHIQVLIGDLLLSYTAREYGDIAKIAEAFGYEAVTLYNWQSTCKSVEISLRSEVVAEVPEGKTLGISHYQLVQSMSPEDQKRWLIEARSEGLSISEMRERIKGKPITRSAYDSWVGSGIAALAKDYKEMKRQEREHVARQIYDVIKDDL